MTLSIVRVESAADRERMYAFRYRVYVDEYAMTTEADHERRWLRDGYDDVGVSYAVLREDGEVQGSLRVIHLADVSDPAPLIDKFRMAPAVAAFGLGAICTTSRFMLDRRLRKGRIIFDLMARAYRDGRARGVRLNYGDCSPHLLPFYEHLGYRRYSSGYNDTAFGYKIPILMLGGDRTHFERLRSPLARLVAEEPDDPELRAWFERTYPGYLGLESAAFLPEEAFFDLLAERVASDPLHKLSLLHGLDRAAAQTFLSRATLIRAEAGDILIREGDRDDTLYVLLSGIAEAVLGDPSSSPPPVAVFGAGDTFGEIGLLAAVPRTANVIARSRAEVLVLSGEFMARIVDSEPAIAAKVLLNLSRELAGRLTVANDRLRARPAVPTGGAAPGTRSIDQAFSDQHEEDRWRSSHATSDGMSGRA